MHILNNFAHITSKFRFVSVVFYLLTDTLVIYFSVTSNQKEVQPDSSEKKVKFSDVQGVSLSFIFHVIDYS